MMNWLTDCKYARIVLGASDLCRRETCAHEFLCMIEHL